MRWTILAFLIVTMWAGAASAADACAEPATATCATEWTTGVDGTSSKQSTLDGTLEAYWSFDAAGESPFLRSHCRETIFMLIGAGDIHPYVCSTNEFPANCLRMESTNMDTAVFGTTVTSATDPFLLGSPFRRHIFQVQSGSPSGHLYAFCAGAD